MFCGGCGGKIENGGNETALGKDENTVLQISHDSNILEAFSIEGDVQLEPRCGKIWPAYLTLNSTVKSMRENRSLILPKAFRPILSDNIREVWHSKTVM